ncbi:unnamed protein product [Mytilus coruscus]|uniref:Uncharacterized protein n=1 Tax=Mytilus coruscus TaxID=42192 RepID=A0A6J8E795_MYTCO|nr:unnamed protein product [Mytilus coruscus]
MLLYSHYIPRANVPKLGYSCSEELMNYAIGRIEQFVMLVGYTTFYGGTNVDASMKFMKEGGINAFLHVVAGNSYKHEVQVFPHSSIDGKIQTFQAEAYACLIDTPISKCCTGTEKVRIAITSYVVNYFTYQCISKLNAIRLFTRLSKKQLSKCLEQELNKNIGDDCNKCSNKNPKSL